MQNTVIKALRPFGTTIFTEMTELSIAHNAVNLSQGFPDFDGPDKIKDIAARAIIEGPNQYCPSSGIPELRMAIADKMKRFYGVDVDPDSEITVTSGATEGICATMLGILEPGDEVIVFEPVYDAYPPLAAMVGAKIRYVSLKGKEFELPREELTEAFNSRTRAVIINNPQNPCGKVFSREELAFIGKLCSRYDAYAIGDEVYEHLVYDGLKHETLLSLPDLRERAFVISSTAKTFSMTGWKIGFVIAAPGLSQAVRMSHQFITFCGQAPLQKAMAEAIMFPDKYYRELLEEYVRKKEWFCKDLEELGFDIIKPQGTYYVVADIRGLGFDDDFEFCRMLAREAGVAAIPCSYFWNKRNGGRNLIRFCFCKKNGTLAEALKRLKNWLK